MLEVAVSLGSHECSSNNAQRCVLSSISDCHSLKFHFSSNIGIILPYSISFSTAAAIVTITVSEELNAPWQIIYYFFYFVSFFNR